MYEINIITITKRNGGVKEIILWDKIVTVHLSMKSITYNFNTLYFNPL